MDIENRQWTSYADEKVRGLMLDLLGSNQQGYRDIMSDIGMHLAMRLIPAFESLEEDVEVCVACSVEDADFLASGLLKQLEATMPGRKIRLACFWNKSTYSPNGLENYEDLEIAPILKEYKEPVNPERCVLIIVKSIISGACVVATNIANLVSTLHPLQVFVVSPVMLENAEIRLQSHFEEDLVRRFEYITFALDNSKDDRGNVQPGIGGEVYVRYGLGNADEKNFVVPNIITDRRRLFRAS